MPHLTKRAASGLFSSALLLGACSYMSPTASHGQPGHYMKNCTTHYSTHCATHPQPVYAPPPKRAYVTPRKTYVAPHPKPMSHPAPAHHYSSVYNKHSSYNTGSGHYTHSYKRMSHHGAPHHGHAHYGHPHSGGGYGYGLRGSFQPYKYGSLGGVIYDLGAGNLGAQARAGYQFTPMLAAEAEGSLGLVKSKTTVGGTVSETDIDTSFAGFGVARFPVSEKITLLGRAGYHVTDIETSETTMGMTTTTGGSQDGLAFGGGAELKLNDRDALRLDYTTYSVPGSDLDALSLGYQRKF